MRLKSESYVRVSKVPVKLLGPLICHDDDDDDAVAADDGLFSFTAFHVFAVPGCLYHGIV